MSRYWVVVPAAGIGQRMQAACPKQYLSLRGQPILTHTLKRLATIKPEAIIVALHPEDSWWADIAKPEAVEIQTVSGGQERCHSVWNALEQLAAQAAADDWVLVHDAARPCVRTADIVKLQQTLAEHSVGGLLGLKITDTVKRSNASGQIIGTIDRSHLWRALTPQMFRYQCLRDALRQIINADVIATDEAQAVEQMGLKPQVVAGQADNIKITTPQDLLLAEFLLIKQEQQ